LLDFRVIAAVSETLKSVLDGALARAFPGPQPPTAEIHDLQGTISTSPARVTLFLFEAFEDPSARNRPARREITPPPQPPGVVLRKSPMALKLHYLITPWSQYRATDHTLLGVVLQFFYDNAILTGPALQGGLAGTDEALAVTLVPLPLEERTRVWHSVQKPYRLSLIYEVRVVNLVSTETLPVQPIARRTIDYALPETTA
jgi:hypothetical protein